MPSRCFVLNEWILHDVAGDNGLDRQRAAGVLLLRLRDGEDRIAVAWNTPWMAKAQSLMSVVRPEVRLLSKLLRLRIILDPQKCLLLDQSSLEPLPEEEEGLLPPKDAYLVQLYRAASADVIVTTDAEFHQKAAGLGIRIVLRDEFLAEHL